MTTRASIARGGTHAIPQPAIVGTVDVVVVVVVVLVVLVLLKEEGAASHQFGGAPDGNARLPRVVAAVVSRLRRRVERVERVREPAPIALSHGERLECLPEVGCPIDGEGLSSCSVIIIIAIVVWMEEERPAPQRPVVGNVIPLHPPRRRRRDRYRDPSPIVVPPSPSPSRLDHSSSSSVVAAVVVAILLPPPPPLMLGGGRHGQLVTGRSISMVPPALTP